jgi:hypothetical protein
VANDGQEKEKMKGKRRHDMEQESWLPGDSRSDASWRKGMNRYFHFSMCGVRLDSWVGPMQVRVGG